MLLLCINSLFSLFTATGRPLTEKSQKVKQWWHSPDTGTEKWRKKQKDDLLFLQVDL